jgi:hypothetical protein
MSVKLVYVNGKIWSDDELQNNSIFVDGSYAGPLIDNKRKIYSFDHHSNCIRHATKSSTKQVYEAIKLGFDPSGFTVYVNDVDADSVASTYMLLNGIDGVPQEVIDVIDVVDCHGPSYPISGALQPYFELVYYEVMSYARDSKFDKNNPEDMLEKSLQLFDDMVKGKIIRRQKNDNSKRIKVTHQSDKFVMVESKNFVFNQAYQHKNVAVVYTPVLSNGTRSYTIGKKSEFVDFDIELAIKKLNDVEPGWGGGSTIGGAPRHEDGRRSMLTPNQVFDIIGSIN